MFCLGCERLAMRAHVLLKKLSQKRRPQTFRQSTDMGAVACFFSLAPFCPAAFALLPDETLIASYKNLTCTPIWRTVYAVMAYKALTVEELLALMKKIQGEKTNTEFAADLGISKQYLSDLYR